MKLGSTLTPHSSKRLWAWTLPEIMVTMAVASIFFAAVATLSMFSARSFVAMGNYADLDRVSRNALDKLIKEVRQTKALTGYTSTRLEFRDWDDANLVYEYSPDTQLFTRTKSGSSTVLLEQCDFLRFNIYQRNPTNDFKFIETKDVRTAKLIDVTWRCSRQILGARVNTESVQTAKIVVRN